MRASVEVVDSTALVLRLTDALGTITTTKLLFSDYQSTQALVAQVNSLSGWLCNFQNNNLSIELKPTVAQNCLAPANPPLSSASTEVIEYSLDKYNGILGINYILPMIEWLPLLVKYNAGYQTVPPALQELATMVALRIYYWFLLNMNLKAQTEGDYSVTYRDMWPNMDNFGGLTPAEYGILNGWKNFALSRMG